MQGCYEQESCYTQEEMDRTLDQWISANTRRRDGKRSIQHDWGKTKKALARVKPPANPNGQTLPLFTPHRQDSHPEKPQGQAMPAAKPDHQASPQLKRQRQGPTPVQPRRQSPTPVKAPTPVEPRCHAPARTLSTIELFVDSNSRDRATQRPGRWTTHTPSTTGFDSRYPSA